MIHMPRSKVKDAFNSSDQVQRNPYIISVPMYSFRYFLTSYDDFNKVVHYQELDKEATQMIKNCLEINEISKSKWDKSENSFFSPCHYDRHAARYYIEVYSSTTKYKISAIEANDRDHNHLIIEGLPQGSMQLTPIF